MELAVCLHNVLEPLTPGDTRPVSMQIAERICDAIEAGRLRQGKRLPTTNQIASRYRTTKGIGREALRRVAAYGYAAAPPDTKGFYVRGLPPRPDRPSILGVRHAR